MAPNKATPSSSSAPPPPALAAPEQVIQAVLVADSFNEHFKPLTLSLPRCLLPLANTPMIEYALECLALSGVQEIFVVCCWQSEEIKRYIRTHWGKSTSPTVTTIVSQELRSTGDALRDLDAKHLIQGDFILISGDIISNLNLSGVLAEHRERRERGDKNSIITMVLQEAGLDHPSRSKSEESVFVLDSASNECLRYLPFSSSSSPNGNSVSLFDPVLFKTHSEISVRNDLIDCRIDICTVEVPALFTENFDYQDIRADFLPGILESDLLGKTVYTHILSDGNGYAAHVSTPQMYHAVSKDVIARWTYPLTPDNFSWDEETHAHSIHNIYKGNDVEVDRSVVLERSVVIGRGTTISAECKISCSVIGRNCQIGRNVVLNNAYIFDETIIGDDVSIDLSIIGANSEIFDRVIINQGCMIEAGVKLGPDVNLPGRTRISKEKIDSTDLDYLSDDDTPFSKEAEAAPGSETAGYIYSFEDDVDEEDKINLARGFLDFDNYPERGNLFENDGAEQDSLDEEGQTDEESGRGTLGDRPRSREQQERDGGSTGGDGEAEEGDEEYDENGTDEEDENDDWRAEVEQTLERAFEENHSIEIAVLELNTLKMAMNITFGDLRQVILPAILSRIPNSSSGETSLAKQLEVFNHEILKWCPILLRLTHTEADQRDCLEIITLHLLTKEGGHLISRMPYLLKNLYNIDLLEEGPILAWHESLESNSGGGGEGKIRESAMSFTSWLREAESDSEEDESD